MAKELWGRKVYEIEKRTGRTLEDILHEYDVKNLPYSEQGVLLGVTASHIEAWRRKLGYPASIKGRRRKNMSVSAIIARSELQSKGMIDVVRK